MQSCSPEYSRETALSSSHCVFHRRHRSKLQPILERQSVQTVNKGGPITTCLWGVSGCQLRSRDRSNICHRHLLGTGLSKSESASSQASRKMTASLSLTVFAAMRQSGPPCIELAICLSTRLQRTTRHTAVTSGNLGHQAADNQRNSAACNLRRTCIRPCDFSQGRINQ
jgi:hypothetical protein